MRTMSREALVAAVRDEVRALVDDDHSMCQVAARLGIGCHGFAQFDEEELERRYAWLVERRRPASREQLEDLANRWQLARQLVTDRSLSCDVQAAERDTCTGWDGYGDEQLAELHWRLTGEAVEVARP